MDTKEEFVREFMVYSDIDSLMIKEYAILKNLGTMTNPVDYQKVQTKFLTKDCKIVYCKNGCYKVPALGDKSYYER